MKPKVLRGMRDLLPEVMVRRNDVVARLEKVFESYGYRPLQTPAMEYYEVLTGKYGEDADRLLYHFLDNGKRHVGLRYDLTVPLARVVAMYPELPRPFRRYQVAPVWRAEKPHRGRHREFFQCDADIVGSPALLVDAEIVALIGDALSSLGIEAFEILLNNRKLLDAIGEAAAVDPHGIPLLCRSLDKLDKIGRHGVESELARRGFEASQVAVVFQILEVDGGPLERLEQLRKRLVASEAGTAAVADLWRVVELAGIAGVSMEKIRIEPALARGMDYYTGTIFEAVSRDVKLGSIAGGGRYDGLIGQVGAKQGLPAAGVSFGLDRLLLVLEELGLSDDTRLAPVQVFVTLFDEASTPVALEICQKLRRSGVRTEMSYETAKLGKQFRHAARIGAALCIVAGPDELAADSVTVKDLRDRSQESVPRDRLVEVVRGRLQTGGG